MAFRIGQKVVCVAPQPYWYQTPPRVRSIYTIREFDGDGVRLVEIVMPITVCFDTETGLYMSVEPSFYLRGYFRPVTEKQTDITVFTEILNRENKNSRVPVGYVTACEVDTNFRHLLKRISDHQSN